MFYLIVHLFKFEAGEDGLGPTANWKPLNLCSHCHDGHNFFGQNYGEKRDGERKWMWLARY